MGGGEPEEVEVCTGEKKNERKSKQCTCLYLPPTHAEEVKNRVHAG